MSFLKRTMEDAKKLPKTALIAAVIVPGGFAAIGIYLVIKNLKDKNKQQPSLKDLINDWKKDD